MSDVTTINPLYLPIVRFDETNWTVTGQATIEDEDAYGTVFDYEASKRAFQAWRGNVREMHDGKKAVGRALDVEYDDENKRIFVTTKISRGAKDTWEKVKDGTLSGYSVGASATKDDWKTIERNGKTLPLLTNYNLVELSLVDHPATPGCNIQIVRADGFANGEVVAEDEVVVESTPIATDQRSIPVAHVDQYTLHSLRDGAFRQFQQVLNSCECDECKAALNAIDPDGDGDIDNMGGMGDLDGDGGKSDMYADYRTLEPMIQRALHPTIQRANGILAQIISQTSNNNTPKIDTSKIEERLTAIEERSATILEVRSLVGTLGTALNEVKELAIRIEKQPLTGGPMLHGAAEKHLSTQGRSTNSPQDDAALIQRASELGLFQDQESQVRAAAKLIQLQRGL